MGNITDITFFETGNKKQIPNISSSSGVGLGDVTSITQLNGIIIDAERQLLTDCLNRSLFLELETALNDLPNADQKWIDLVEGVDYLKDGKTVRFEGLRGYLKDSLVAYYVFCEYMQRDDSYYSTTGTVKATQKGAANYGGTKKFNDAYNTFVKYYQNDISHNECNYIIDAYGCVVGLDYYKQDYESSFITLETYLEDNKTDFEGYSFRRYERKNSFDL